MLVISGCCWLYVGDKISILVTSFGCWCPTLMLKDRGCWWQERSPTSQDYRQHISSRTSVTNIDVAENFESILVLFGRKMPIRSVIVKNSQFSQYGKSWISLFQVSNSMKKFKLVFKEFTFYRSCFINVVLKQIRVKLVNLSD